ncbi:hypothetical protein GQ54DRAFT_207303 [Martensiomyces pterosporus]|nr:hypothetical protein GQ54DRAFT_207303 [Martensiomyces pterosporus]
MHFQQWRRVRLTWMAATQSRVSRLYIAWSLAWLGCPSLPLQPIPVLWVLFLVLAVSLNNWVSAWLHGYRLQWRLLRSIHSYARSPACPRGHPSSAETGARRSRPHIVVECTRWSQQTRLTCGESLSPLASQAAKARYAG